jgi:hypothetical protein
MGSLTAARFGLLAVALALAACSGRSVTSVPPSQPNNALFPPAGPSANTSVVSPSSGPSRMCGSGIAC